MQHESIDTWRALVLGGGGAIGEFQLGALQVLAERYDSFDMYVGVGVGALNSSVLAQYDTVDDGFHVLAEVWRQINDIKDIFDVPFLGPAAAAIAALISDEGFARDGIYGNGKLLEVINEYIDWDRLQHRSNWAIETTSISDGQLYTVTNNAQLLLVDTNPRRRVTLSLNPADRYYIGKVLAELVAAAGSVPLMLPPVEVFGLKFLEGGLRDFTPLELAVKAYEIARDNGYKRGEFIVVDNYTQELAFDGADLLDSGVEIAMRAVKIMTVEMAQNDIARGRARLASVDKDANVILVQPTIDYRLSPMDFGNTLLRRQLRDHGVTRATLSIPHEATRVRLSIETTYKAFLEDPENAELAERIAQHAAVHPEEAERIREKIRPASRQPTPTKARGDAVEPRNLAELMSVMRAAHGQGERIKAVGAGYAFSDILQTTGISLSLAPHLNGIWDVDSTILKDPANAASLVEFEAGATIDELNSFLAAQHRALLNQPGYEKLNFVGVASTGGHGSGIRFGPIADAICTINLLTFDAQGNVVQVRVEPSDGITDSARFGRLYPGIRLIQDDTYYRACKVAVGCVGVIYSVLIKTQPAFFLAESRTLELWDDLQQVLPNKLQDERIHSIHIWFNPYPVKGRRHCVLSEYRVVNGPARGRRSFGTTFGLIPQLAPLLLWLMEHLPRAIPAIINASLKATVNRIPVIMPVTEALNFGTPNQVHVDATDCSIPSEMVIDAANRLFVLAQELFQGGALLTCPFGFRFVAASDAFLAPQYGRSTCMIEMPLIWPTPHASTTIDAFLQLLIKEFHGRPHWGQEFNQNITPATLPRLYPALASFKDVFEELNDGTFDNDFTKAVGLRDK